MWFNSLTADMNKLDVEQVLRAKLADEDEGVELNKLQGQALLDRLVSYRKRIQQLRRDQDLRLAPLQRRIADLERSIGWASERLDPENAGTHYSYMDRCEVALHIEAIEKKRGRIVAQRLIWGQDARVDAQNETIDVLKAAVADANAEKDRWFCYLNEARKKDAAAPGV